MKRQKSETAYVKAPIGWLKLTASAEGLRSISFCKSGQPKLALQPHLKKAQNQLTEYFAGARKKFDLTLAPEGTEFQKEVWTALQTIPFGKSASYNDIAKKVGRPLGARAVGMANNRNPLPIVVPCHRVIGANGSLVGYAGGLEIKKSLLEAEGCPLRAP